MANLPACPLAPRIKHLHRHSAWLRPDLKKWEEPGATPKAIYDDMAHDGLSRYTKKQLLLILKTP